MTLGSRSPRYTFNAGRAPAMTGICSFVLDFLKRFTLGRETRP